MKTKFLQNLIKLSKLSFYMLCIVCLSLSSLIAGETKAQIKSVKEVQININLKQVSLAEALTSIEERTNFNFILSKEKINLNQKINLDYPNGTVEEVLLGISRQANVRFRQINENIDIRKIKKSDQPENAVIVLADVDISGQVKDEKGQGLPGASVVQKGTTNGTTTDLDGNYKLNLPEGSIIAISFVGYKNQEIIIGAQSVIDIQMEVDAEQLEEIIVVGFGEQKKQSVTGAVEAIDGDAVFSSRAITNPALSLQGQTPGLVVTRGSSRPGQEDINLQIRGFASLQDAQPLIVIDGVPIIGTSEFYNMNPDDIESLSVLKDGSASIYGSRAAHGVILVTTKKGSRDGLQVTYSTNLRTQKVGILAPVADARAYGQMFVDAAKEDATPVYWAWGQENVELMASGYTGLIQNTAWGEIYIGDANRYDQMFGDATSHQHNLSVSGGNDKSRYRISALYADNKGALKLAYDGQKQYNLRMNFDHEISDKITFTAGMMYQKTNNSRPSNGVNGQAFYQDPWLFVPKNPAGQWYGNFNIANWNPIGSIVDGGRTSFEESQSKINLGLNAEIIEGLSVEVTGSYNSRIGSTDVYSTQFPVYSWTGDFNGLSARVTPRVIDQYAESAYFNFGSYLDYKKTVGSHNFSARVGVTGDKFMSEGVSAERRQFEDQGVYDLNVAPTTDVRTSGGADQWGLYGYIARLNYDYEGKYLFEVLGRADISSKFAEGFKNLNYMGGSAGWVISGEEFMSDVSFIDFLKIRASYGEMGNQSGLGNFDFLSSMSFGTLPFGSSPVDQTTARIPTITDPSVTWERVKMINVGLDFRTLNNRLTGAFDYFTRKNDGMLMGIEYAAVLGRDGNGPDTNSGNLKSWGWEVSLGWKDKIGEVSYYVSANMSDSQNEIVTLEGSNLPDTGTGGINIEGYPANSIFLWETDGFFTSQGDVDAYYAAHSDGSNIGSLPGALGTNSALRAGDVKKVDRDGDGFIDGYKDLMFAGDLNPHNIYGLTMGANWKGFDFMATFQGVLSQNVYRSGHLSFPFRHTWTNFGASWAGKTWREDNTGADYPRLTANNGLARYNYNDNEYLLQNNRYMRFKTLIIGYTLPTNMTDKIGLGSARVYFSGNDLFEFTTIKDGYDPENGEAASSVYPFMRTYSLGIDLRF